MPGEIFGNIVCRDIDKLPDEDTELRQFFDDVLAPALWNDFSTSYKMMSGQATTRSIAIIDMDALTRRGCEVVAGGRWTF